MEKVQTKSFRKSLEWPGREKMDVMVQRENVLSTKLCGGKKKSFVDMLRFHAVVKV